MAFIRKNNKINRVNWYALIVLNNNSQVSPCLLRQKDIKVKKSNSVLLKQIQAQLCQQSVEVGADSGFKSFFVQMSLGDQSALKKPWPLYVRRRVGFGIMPHQATPKACRGFSPLFCAKWYLGAAVCSNKDSEPCLCVWLWVVCILSSHGLCNNYNATTNQKNFLHEKYEKEEEKKGGNYFQPRLSSLNKISQINLNLK